MAGCKKERTEDEQGRRTFGSCEAVALDSLGGGHPERMTGCPAREKELTCWNDNSTSSAARVWGSGSPSACEGTTSFITR